MDAQRRRAGRAHGQRQRAAQLGDRSSSRPGPTASRSPSAGSTCCSRCRRCARSQSSSPTTRSPYAAVGPAFWGDGLYPPDNAVYFPLYTKCCELELPLCMNAGLPGPPIPGEAQNPIHLDRVCVRFPELKLCMIARRRPVVGRRDPADDQVPEPAPDDVGVGAEVPARGAAALHAHPRQAARSSSRPTPRCCRSRGRSARPGVSICPPEVIDNYLFANSERFFERLDQAVAKELGSR